MLTPHAVVCVYGLTQHVSASKCTRSGVFCLEDTTVFTVLTQTRAVYKTLGEVCHLQVVTFGYLPPRTGVSEVRCGAALVHWSLVITLPALRE